MDTMMASWRARGGYSRTVHRTGTPQTTEVRDIREATAIELTCNAAGMFLRILRSRGLVDTQHVRMFTLSDDLVRGLASCSETPLGGRRRVLGRSRQHLEMQQRKSAHRYVHPKHAPSGAAQDNIDIVSGMAYRTGASRGTDEVIAIASSMRGGAGGVWHRDLTARSVPSVLAPDSNRYSRPSAATVAFANTPAPAKTAQFDGNPVPRRSSNFAGTLGMIGTASLMTSVVCSHGSEAARTRKIQWSAEWPTERAHREHLRLVQLPAAVHELVVTGRCPAPDEICENEVDSRA
ncbi:hypothetical protein VTO73DRAFT_13395 [Trametes versicolor]